MKEPSRELLTLHPSQEQRQELVDNILAVYDRASPAARSQGMSWYKTAHDLAGMVGFGDYSKGAAIIAALSANTGWTQNQKLALAIGAGQEVSHLQVVKDKLDKILSGEPPLAVLGKGLKTLNFYRNIHQPERSGPVTIDRHAHDIARGEPWGGKNRALTTATRYAVLADAYRLAAIRRDIRPHEMQAVTWVQWRNENGQDKQY